jgi:hypothetical protein
MITQANRPHLSIQMAKSLLKASAVLQDEANHLNRLERKSPREKELETDLYRSAEWIKKLATWKIEKEENHDKYRFVPNRISN